MKREQSYVLYEMLFPNGKRYFGVTNSFDRRMREHYAATVGDSDLVVYRALRKYGFDAVKKRVVVIGNRDYILDLEIKVISAYRTHLREFGYNVSLGGFIPSEETRQKYSLAMKRRWGDPAYRVAMSQKLTGRVKTETERENIRRALKGKKKSPSHIEALKISHRGIVPTAEHHEYMRKWWTPERRAAHGAKRKGCKANNGIEERNRAKSKLSPEQVGLLHHCKNGGVANLARKFGISVTSAHGIRKRRIWKEWPVVVDRAALAQVFGPLGQYVEPAHMDAAVYRYMREHQKEFKEETITGLVPGVVFQWTPDSRIV